MEERAIRGVVPGEPITSRRTNGYRIVTGTSTVLECIDVYAYEGGEVKSIAIRRPGHETIAGSRYVVTDWPGRDFLDVVRGHEEFERGTGCLTDGFSVRI